MRLVKNPRKLVQLNQLTMMKRANGAPFTLMRRGQAHLALWPNTESAVRYKTRNPELLVFSPMLVASPSGQKNLADSQRDDMGLWLLTESSRAHFSDGRRVCWKEIESLLPASPSNKEQTRPIVW
jgi:hypothetical protein